MALEKRAWCGAMLKLARGNTNADAGKMRNGNSGICL